jgi:heat-inducible transcriptional repressor
MCKNPRRLQLNASSLSWRHSPQRRRRKPWARAGLDFETIRQRLQTERVSLRDDITRRLQRTVAAGNQAATENAETVMISGERNLVAIHELSDNMDRLRRLFGMFDRRTGLAQLLDASSHAEGVRICIGSESQLVPMDEPSIVIAP